MDDVTQHRLDSLLYRLCGNAKLVLLIDQTGREIASHGIRYVRVNLRPLIKEIGDSHPAALALKRLAATEARWSTDDGSEQDLVDLVVLNGRWSVLFVFRTREDLDLKR